MPLTFSSNGGGSYGSAVPFQRQVEPSQMGFFLGLDQRELLRIQRYNEGWRFYFGKHWMFKREDGEALVTFNYFRKIIDKSVAFLVAKGFHVKVPEALEEITLPFVNEVWDYNKREQFAWDAATMGAVTGDVFIMVTWVEPTETAKKINPFTQGKIQVNLLGSEQVYPTWDPLNTDTLLSVRIETIYYADGMDRNATNTEGRQVPTKRFTQIITPDTIVEQFHGEKPVVRANFLGEIPVIHIRNLGIPKEYYGLPDAMDLIDLQREYNEKATDISDTVNYHACVDDETEALTRHGWKQRSALSVGCEVLCLDPETDEITWQPIEALNAFTYAGDLVRWDNRIDALTTPNHRWLAERKIGRPENARYAREFVRTSEAEGGEAAVADLRVGSLLRVGGGVPTHFPCKSIYADEFVELVGWWVTEASVNAQPSGNFTSTLAQSVKVNQSFVDDIRLLATYWRAQGESFRENATRPDGIATWYIGTGLTAQLLAVCPDKSLPAEFLARLTLRQAERLMEVLIDADGTRTTSGRTSWYQDDPGRKDGMQMLAAMLSGARTRAYENVRGNGVVDFYQTGTIEALSTVSRAQNVRYDGTVWCPTVKTGVWFARRSGYTYWTGNSPITCIFGAKAKQLEKGPRQIWAGLPSDARVENLRLEGDLTAANTYLDKVKLAIHELSDVPEGSLGGMQAISNTSGVALHLQYQPLVEKTQRKKAQYEPGFQQLNYFILRIGTVMGQVTLPYDICKNCGGRIVEVDTGETTRVWNTESERFEKMPVRKKKCFHIDKQTLEFTDPFKMRVKIWRMYGFGDEIREVPYDQLLEEIEGGSRSFWDYTVYQEEGLKKWKEENAEALQEAHTAAQDNANVMQPPPEPQYDPETGEAIPPPEPPTNEHPDVLPEAPKPPPIFVVKKLPMAEIDVPGEPERTTIVRKWLHPVTGVLLEEETEEKILVPTECQRPQYLNPYENTVEFQDVLPKDEALQAQLYQTYLAMEIVDEEWVQDQIPEVAKDATEIRKRMKAKKAAERQADPAVIEETEGGTKMTYQEAAPPPGAQATVPGKGGNPIPANNQLGGGQLWLKQRF